MEDNLLDSDGFPNYSNPIVLASFIDLIGSAFTQNLKDIGNNGGVADEQTMQDLLRLHRILLAMRSTIGRNEEWSKDNLFPLAADIMDASSQAQRSRGKPTPAEVADAIIRDLANN
jgi:hypothetical protein